MRAKPLWIKPVPLYKWYQRELTPPFCHVWAHGEVCNPAGMLALWDIISVVCKLPASWNFAIAAWRTLTLRENNFLSPSIILHSWFPDELQSPKCPTRSTVSSNFIYSTELVEVYLPGLRLTSGSVSFHCALAVALSEWIQKLPPQ